MSATTTATSPAGQHNLSFGGVVSSEWIKLRTLRSTVWCYLIIIVVTIGLALLLAASSRSSAGPRGGAAAALPGQAAWLQVTTPGIGLAQLVVAVLGALVITGEYGTGMIRSTFAAVPTRLPAVVAKALVLGVSTFIVSLVALIAAALVTAPFMPDKGVTPDFGDWHIWWALVGGAGYLAFIALLSFSIGALIRNSAGGIAASLGFILVVPTIVSIFASVTQADWVRNLGSFLPSDAGGRMYAYVTDAAVKSTDLIVLTPWQGALVLAAWIVLLFTIAAVLIKRRDA
jgi:ABC-2 type transport system permease protein